MDEPRAEVELTSEHIRGVSFPRAFQGYDRPAVDAFLERVAEWAEGVAAPGTGPDLKRELERVGERTAAILTAAEEAATRAKVEAAEEADALRESAEREARARELEAARKAEDIVAGAQERAETILDEAMRRRRQLNLALASVLDRRTQIADETQALGEELLELVSELRASTPPAADEAAEPRRGRFAPGSSGPGGVIEPADELAPDDVAAEVQELEEAELEAGELETELVAEETLEDAEAEETLEDAEAEEAALGAEAERP
jgi:DivIVA domain-containing protein